MNVFLIAHTQTTDAFADVIDDLEFERDMWTEEAEDLIEFAGRSCYESYSKPNKATRDNRDYLANVAKQKHFSVFEHASVTFFIRDSSRAFTHELVRHRHFSYSQVSQRYCDSSKRRFVEHPVLQKASATSDGMIADHWDASVQLYEQLVEELVEAGHSRKEARGAARLVLPEGTTTDIVVTGNFRSWIEFLEKRATEHADAEIREVAEEIKRQLQDTFPNAFQDAVFQEEDREKPVSLQSEPARVDGRWNIPAIAITDENLEDAQPPVLAYIQAEIKKAFDQLYK